MRWTAWNAEANGWYLALCKSNFEKMTKYKRIFFIRVNIVKSYNKYASISYLNFYFNLCHLSEIFSCPICTKHTAMCILYFYALISEKVNNVKICIHEGSILILIYKYMYVVQIQGVQQIRWTARNAEVSGWYFALCKSNFE